MCLMYHNTDNNMYYVLQHWQHYVLRITTLTKICLMCHKTDNNMSYVAQHWQPYLMPVTKLTTIFLAYHNTDNSMPYVLQHWNQYRIRITTLTIICLTYHNTDNDMSYVCDIAVSVVKRMACCCQYCDAKEILLAVFWQVWDMVVSPPIPSTKEVQRVTQPFQARAKTRWFLQC